MKAYFWINQFVVFLNFMALLTNEWMFIKNGFGKHNLKMLTLTNLNDDDLFYAILTYIFLNIFTNTLIQRYEQRNSGLFSANAILLAGVLGFISCIMLFEIEMLSLDNSYRGNSYFIFFLGGIGQTISFCVQYLANVDAEEKYISPSVFNNELLKHKEKFDSDLNNKEKHIQLLKKEKNQCQQEFVEHKTEIKEQKYIFNEQNQLEKRNLEIIKAQNNVDKINFEKTISKFKFQLEEAETHLKLSREENENLTQRLQKKFEICKNVKDIRGINFHDEKIKQICQVYENQLDTLQLSQNKLKIEMNTEITVLKNRNNTLEENAKQKIKNLKNELKSSKNIKKVKADPKTEEENIELWSKIVKLEKKIKLHQTSEEVLQQKIIKLQHDLEDSRAGEFKKTQEHEDFKQNQKHHFNYEDNFGSKTYFQNEIGALNFTAPITKKLVTENECESIGEIEEYDNTWEKAFADIKNNAFKKRVNEKVLKWELELEEELEKNDDGYKLFDDEDQVNKKSTKQTFLTKWT